MSPNPYENEPGFENQNSSEDKKAQAQYVAKVLILFSISHLPAQRIVDKARNFADIHHPET